jgi:hypothetical protein
MSDYLHFGLGVVQRSRGGSAQERSTYQSRGRLDLPGGRVIDYSDRGDHFQTLMLAPPGAPDWATDPKQFWRNAAAAETLPNAQEARTMEVSIPRGLPQRLWSELARKVASVMVAHGMVVQVDIHCTIAADGKPNPHMHFLMSMRELENGRFAKLKARHWNKLFYGNAAALRREMAEFLNAFCKQKNVAYQADPRSNAARGLLPAEMSLPRWNLIAYKRTGKKTPWLEQRDREREERAKIAALETECADLERKIARREAEAFAARYTASAAGIDRNEASREPAAGRRRPQLIEHRLHHKIGDDQFHPFPRSTEEESSRRQAWLRRPPDDPTEPDTEITPWRQP